MLEIINYNCDEYEFPSLLVLGCFDALHAGHIDLLKKAKLQAKINGLDLGIMMFAEGKGGRQVFTFNERISFLEAHNVKFVLKIDFTEEFKKITANEFLSAIDGKINVKGFMSGKDFRFGAGGKGKVSTLKNYAADEENGVWYASVNDVLYDGEKISTTMIKTLIENGDIKTANELLSRNFFVTGTVVRGADRGKNLGFPTMNVTYPENKIEVKQGVYSVICRAGGSTYKGIANYGARPTFEEDATVLEVHLADFDGSNYGEEVTVEFVDYLRDIKKFDTPEELIAQLEEDLKKIN